jgi:molybdate transport system substrate-binding protein
VSGTSPGAADAAFTVFAAASLTDTLAKLAERYEEGEPDVHITTSFDSSSALRAQIEQGAPADLFLAADLVNAQALADAGLGTAPVPFARNRLTLIVPASNPAGLTSAFDLARPGMRVIAAGEAVPVSAYASELVERIGRSPGAPVGFAEGYRANVVSREDNVRAVLTRIELGEGDAAIVYATDAASTDEVIVVPLPAGVEVAATYAGAVISGSRGEAAAARFLDWLSGPDAQAVFREHGFEAAAQ